MNAVSRHDTVAPLWSFSHAHYVQKADVNFMLTSYNVFKANHRNILSLITSSRYNRHI